MRRGLVGDDVDERPSPSRSARGAAPAARAAPRRRCRAGRSTAAPALVAGLQRQLDRVVEVAGLDVEVAGLEPAVDAVLVALDADRDAVVHGHRERLRAAHAAEAGGHGDGAGERPAEALVRDRGEGLEGALQDALGADVDPRAGRHLAVHRQPEVLEPAELLPVGPVADEVGVGDQHARRPRVGAHHADRLAGLHEQRLVVLEVAQGADDGVVRLPAARRLAGAAVDDEVLGALGVVGVEVVHQHPQRRLGLPRLRGQLGAGGGVDGQARVAALVECLREASGCIETFVHFSSPITDSAAARTAPDWTSATAASISGERWRSGPGPSMPEDAQEVDDRRGGGRRGQRRAQVERPGGGEHLDGDHAGEAVDRAAQLAGGVPAHRDVVLLHGAGGDGVDGRRAPRAA